MNSEELFQIIKKNLQNLIVVDDVLEIPEINSIPLESSDSHLNENELYESLRSFKKKAQLRLNLYKSASVYANCQILNEDNYSSTSSEIFNCQISLNEYEEDSVLIESICCYIKSYQFLLNTELKSVEKNEKSIFISQNNKRDSQISNNEITGNNENTQKPCNKCSFINRKSLVNCEMCFSSLNDFISYKKPNYDNIKKSPSLQIEHMQPVQSQFIIFNKNLLPKSFYRVLFRYKFYKTDKWECKKCGMKNITNFCVACLNCSPNINKWQCENCGCLNNIINGNCKYCQSENLNLIVCPGCKKMKIIPEREKCDKCWIKDFSHFKTNKAVKRF